MHLAKSEVVNLLPNRLRNNLRGQFKSPKIDIIIIYSRCSTPPSCRWNAQHAQGLTLLPCPHQIDLDKDVTSECEAKRQRAWNGCNRNNQQYCLCFNGIYDILCSHRLSAIRILPLLGSAILQLSITRSCYLKSGDYVANWVGQSLTCASDIYN